MTWRPEQREAKRALEGPYDDMPPHLIEPTWRWAQDFLQLPAALERLGIAMRWRLPPAVEGNTGEARAQVWRHVEDDPVQLLDVVDWLLDQDDFGDGTFVDLRDIEELDSLLDEGNSMYRVREDGRRLEARIVPEVRQQVQAVVDSVTGSAGAHLATAWNAAHGRVQDPVKAYSEAIKAVEAAAVPVVSPSNDKATLGTIIRDLRAKPGKWHFAIRAPGDEGVDEVRRMMKLLWEGQTSRHGGVGPTEPESPEAARVAVVLAAALVQLCADRGLSIRSDTP